MGGVGWVGWDCGVLDFPGSLPRLQTESGLEVRRLNSSRGQIIDLGQPHFSPDSKTNSHEAKKGPPQLQQPRMMKKKKPPELETGKPGETHNRI